MKVEAASGSLGEGKNAKKNLLRYLRWRDLIVIVLGVALGSWINAHYFKFKEPTDYQKWQARPKLDPIAVQKSGRRIDPCFFVLPAGAKNQPVVSGSVGDCLMLVPDGKILDVFEVALLWGDFFHIKTDLSVSDTASLAFTRTHNADYAWAKRVRSYFRHVYDPFLYGDRSPYTYLRWVLPDGLQLNYRRVSTGTGFADAVYEEDSQFPVFGGSRIAWNGWGWDLTLADGTTYLSPEAHNARRPQQGSLSGIFDKNGNEIRLAREANGDLTKIESPTGQWISLAYSHGFITRVTTSSKAWVEYKYDGHGRLSKVTESHGETTEYEYNLFSHVTKIVDSMGSNILEISYDPHDRDNKVIQLSLPDGRIFHLAYLSDKETESSRVDITDAQGQVTRVTLNAKPGKDEPYYAVEKPANVPAQR